MHFENGTPPPKPEENIFLKFFVQFELLNISFLVLSLKHFNILARVKHILPSWLILLKSPLLLNFILIRILDSIFFFKNLLLASSCFWRPFLKQMITPERLFNLKTKNLIKECVFLKFGWRCFKLLVQLH